MRLKIKRENRSDSPAEKRSCVSGKPENQPRIHTAISVHQKFATVRFWPGGIDLRQLGRECIVFVLIQLVQFLKREAEQFSIADIASTTSSCPVSIRGLCTANFRAGADAHRMRTTTCFGGQSGWLQATSFTDTTASSSRESTSFVHVFISETRAEKPFGRCLPRGFTKRVMCGKTISGVASDAMRRTGL